MQWYLAYLALGAFTGFFAGLFGIGGGLIFVPMLSALFGAQHLGDTHNLHLALGTSMATILYTAAASARAHHQHGAVNFQIVYHITPGLLFGTLLGTMAARHISSVFLSGFFALFMSYVAVQMALELKPKPSRQLPKRVGLTLVGTGIGAVSSLVSVGGGTLSIPFMLYHNVPLRHAIGTSAAMGIPIALGGTIGYVTIGINQAELPAHSLGFVYLPAMGLLMLGSLFTTPIGAKAAHRLPLKPLRRGFAILLLILAGKMVWQAVSS